MSHFVKRLADNRLAKPSGVVDLLLTVAYIGNRQQPFPLLSVVGLLHSLLVSCSNASISTVSRGSAVVMVRSIGVVASVMLVTLDAVVAAEVNAGGTTKLLQSY